MTTTPDHEAPLLINGITLAPERYYAMQAVCASHLGMQDEPVALALAAPRAGRT